MASSRPGSASLAGRGTSAGRGTAARSKTPVGRGAPAGSSTPARSGSAVRSSITAGSSIPAGRGTPAIPGTPAGRGTSAIPGTPAGRGATAIPVTPSGRGTPAGKGCPRPHNKTINPTAEQLTKLENAQKIRLQDALDHEFNYYCVLARQLTGSLMNEERRNEFITWIHLLVNPLIISSQEESIRVKRNRYLFLMVVSMLNNEHDDFLRKVSKAHKKFDFKKKSVKVAGMRGSAPRDAPEKIANEKGIPNTIQSALPPTRLLDSHNPNPEWERQRTWDDFLESINKVKTQNSKKKLCKAEKFEQKCIFHHLNKCEITPVSQKIGHALDLQFEFIIALARNAAMALGNSMQQTTVWMQALCEIDKTFCTEMKGIRNDYACLLIGYMTNNQLDGPFEDPPTRPLCPLHEAAMKYARRRPAGLDASQVPLNPVSDTVENFMNECPLIDEGAFAFLSLSGSMFSGN